VGGKNPLSLGVWEYSIVGRRGRLNKEGEKEEGERRVEAKTKVKKDSKVQGKETWDWRRGGGGRY
jgi:hypothetical protein